MSRLLHGTDCNRRTGWYPSTSVDTSRYLLIAVDSTGFVSSYCQDNTVQPNLSKSRFISFQKATYLFECGAKNLP